MDGPPAWRGLNPAPTRAALQTSRCPRGWSGTSASRPSVLEAAEGQAALPVALQEQEGHDYGYDGDEGPRYHQGEEWLRPAARSRQLVPRDQSDAQRVELRGAKNHERKEAIVPCRHELQEQDSDEAWHQDA